MQPIRPTVDRRHLLSLTLYIFLCLMRLSYNSTIKNKKSRKYNPRKAASQRKRTATHIHVRLPFSLFIHYLLLKITHMIYLFAIAACAAARRAIGTRNGEQDT